MTEHRNWNEKRPPSDLPNSTIAREFIMRTIGREDQSRYEVQAQEEDLFGRSGFGVKLFNRFYEQTQLLRTSDNTEYRSITIQVFQKPESEFDRAVLYHIVKEDDEDQDEPHRTPAILFNDEWPGVSVHVACEIDKLTEISDPRQEPKITFAVSVNDENGAEITAYRHDVEVRAAIREGESEFRFAPSVNSIMYLTEIFEVLYRSEGSDEK